MQTYILQYALASLLGSLAAHIGLESSLNLDRSSGVGVVRFVNHGQTDILLCNWPGSFDLVVETATGKRIPARDQRFVDTVPAVMPFDWIVLRSGQAFETQVIALRYGRPYKKIPRTYRVWVEISKKSSDFILPKHIKGHAVQRVKTIGRVFAK